MVLCDGPSRRSPCCDYWLTGADLFVCADAAGHPYDHLPRLPDVVIGDFDSLAGRILAGRDGPRFLQVADQYTTDSEKALIYLDERRASRRPCCWARRAGAWTTPCSTCQLLERFAGRHAHLHRRPPRRHRAPGAGEPVSWELPAGTRFSLLPLSGPVTGVTIEGAKYPLLGETLEPGGPATISNRVTMSPLLISVGDGFPAGGGRPGVRTRLRRGPATRTMT